MVAEYSNSGTMLRRYVHGSNADADDPLLWYGGTSTASSNARHLYADPRGSIALVAGASGNTIAINTYDAYGIPGSANTGRFQYTGQIWIEALGMYYYKARIYSPTLGRFLQTDPIGYEDQINLYAYVGNDPVNLVDPTGEEIKFAGEKTEKLNAMLEEYRSACDECANAVQTLEDSDNLHIIADATILTDPKSQNALEDAGGGESVAFPRSAVSDKARHDGTGTGTLIIVDLDSPPTVDGVEYSQTSRLAHELDHSVKSDSGQLSKNPVKMENSAIDQANKYRKAVGERLRPRISQRAKR